MTAPAVCRLRAPRVRRDRWKEYDPPSTPQPDVAQAAQRGWHGMRARPDRLYRPDDWRTWGKFQGDACLVDVTYDSPAWRADLRDGTWVLLANQMTFKAFEARGMPAGSVVSIKAFRPGFGDLDVTITLVDQPKPKRAPRRASRSRVPLAECGRPITRDDRPKWLMELSQNAYLSTAARTIGTFLCNRAIRDNGSTDEWPVKRIAKCVGLSRRTVERSIGELHRAGLVAIASGRRARRNNIYTCTHSPTVRDDKLVYLPHQTDLSPHQTDLR